MAEILRATATAWAHEQFDGLVFGDGRLSKES